MKKYIYVMLILNSITLCYSQAVYHYDSKWYIGAGTSAPCIRGYAEYDFSTDSVTREIVPMDSLTINYEIDFDVTSTAFFDSAGNILFYSNGHQVRNSQHQMMIGGDTIVPSEHCKQYVATGSLLPQGVLALPIPEKTGEFYLFNEGPERENYPYCLRLNMSTITTNPNSLAQNNVLPRNITVIEDTIAYGQLTACKHANGIDYWVIVPDWGRGFFKLLVTSSGIDSFYQRTNNFYDDYNNWSQVVFTPDGRQYIRASVINDGYNIHIFDFNRCTGLFLNERKFFLPVTQTGVAGAAISPNSRMLYVASPFQIDQLDLAATDILASRITVATLDTTTFSCSGPGSYYGFFLGQLATNGKIYFSTPYLSTDALHIINYPDSIGLACQVIQHGLSDIGANYMVPNHPNYYLPALTMPCDSILSGFEEGDIGQNTVILSPNPATTTIDLRFSLPLAANTMLTIYNSLGQQIEKQTLAEGIQRYTYNVASWANGIYFYRIVTGEQMLAGKWLIKK